MRVCLGGTFEPFHVGHQALLERAVEGAGHVFVGITDRELAKRSGRSVSGWKKRARVVESFLRDSLEYEGALTVRALEDADGPAAWQEFDAIVVSYETRASAKRINARREKNGLGALQVRVVGPVLGEDRLPVQATHVHGGRIDASGKRLCPVVVAVGSQNPVKLRAVRQEFQALLPGVDLDVRSADVASGVPEQPKSKETLSGARNRASAAFDAVGDADYAVGVEAGLNQDPDAEAWYDVQACVIRDRTGHETVGWGPAFQYPAWVTDLALDGQMISEILAPVADDPRIGGTTGAIGFLTDGRLDRVGLTRQAVLMAWVPRLRRGLYEADGPP